MLASPGRIIMTALNIGRACSSSRKLEFVLQTWATKEVILLLIEYSGRYKRTLLLQLLLS
jgi:hypothetical protein